MSEKKLGRESAYPFEHVKERVGPAATRWETNHGMSKRFYAACAAMQGILSNESGFFLYGTESTRTNLDNKVKFAYMCADELLRQENL